LSFIDIIKRKAVGGFGGGIATSGFVDAYKSRRAPTKYDLVQSYKNTAYACAMINARALASLPLRVYAYTKPRQDKPRFWEQKEIDWATGEWLKSQPGIQQKIMGAKSVVELFDHPLQSLLNRVNDFMTRFDLFEYTTASQDICGDCFWYPAREGDDGKPVEIYVLESHRVTIIPDRSSTGIIDHYEYANGLGKSYFSKDEIIHFKACSLADPYIFGLSSLRASYEQNTVSDKLIAYEEAVLDNRARPDMLISPKDAIGATEAARLERKFQNKFRGGGSGGVIVGESGLDYKALVFPPSDLAALQIRKVSKEEIANAFGVPIAMLRTEDVNRANAEAAEYRHAKGAVLPRAIKIQEMINKRLCPMFDDRIFVAFDNPVREDENIAIKKMEAELKWGTMPINEYRRSIGKEPIDGCDYPFLPGNYAPVPTLNKIAENLASPEKPKKPAVES